MIKGKLLKSFILFILVLGAFFIVRTPDVHAAGLTYNPNNIIRDDIFTNSGSMSVQDVQNFLAARGSCLANVDVSELGNTGQSAAQLIVNAAQTNGINPQVLLVTLAKEQSLIDQSCAQLDNRQGHTYALTHALGYNVPDVLGVGECLYSFTSQMLGNNCGPDHYMGGPASMRWSFDNNKVGPGGSYAFPTAFTVQEYSDRAGNITITPRSKATAMLYRYTPYAYYGNYNFFNIYTSYFGNPAYGENFSIIKSNDIAEISVLYNGVRYPFVNMESINAWGVQNIPVSVISSFAYYNYPVGGIMSRVFKESDGPRVFVASHGVARHISTSSYVDTFGLSNELVGNLPQGLIFGLMPEGNPVGFLVKATGQNAIYLAQAGIKYYIADIPTIEAWGFQMSELIEVTPTELETVPTVGTLTTLVRGSGPDIFVATLHTFVYAPSTARLSDWNMERMSVTWLDDAFLNSLPKRGTLSRLTRGTGPDTYYIENKRRYYVSKLSTSIALESQYGTLTPMADTTISRIPYVGRK